MQPIPKKDDRARPPLISAQQVEAAAGATYLDSTPILRSAVWTDSALRRDVIRERVENHRRVPAREPGLVSGKVVDEAVKARDTLAMGGLWVAVALGVCVLFNVFVALSVGTLMVLLLNLTWIRATPHLRWTQRIPRLGGHALLLFLLWQLVFAAVVYLSSEDFLAGLEGDSSAAGEGTLGFVEPPSTSDGGSVALLLLMPASAAALLLFAALVGIVYQVRQRSNATLLNIRLRSGETVRGSGIGARPVSFYSSFDPFVGSGVGVDSWPVTLKLFPSRDPRSGTPTNQEGAAVPTFPPDPTTAAAHQGPPTGRRLEGADLVEAAYERLRHELPTLGGGENSPGTHRRVEVADTVFLYGLRFDDAWELIPALLDARGQALHPEWVRAFVEAEHERARHFLSVGVSMWEGQVVLTAFVRLTSRSGQLRVEGETLLMPPLSHRYQAPAGPLPTGRTGGEIRELLWESLRHVFGDSCLYLSEGVALLRSRWATKRNDRLHAWAGEQGELFDYAPRLGIREHTATDELEQLFQSHDVRRFERAIKEKVMTCVRDVLCESGYDTEQIRQVIQHFTNNGVQFNGDVNNSGNMFGQNVDGTRSATSTPNH